MSTNTLYKDIAMYYNITVSELIERLTKKGEPLVHKYYVAKGFI